MKRVLLVIAGGVLSLGAGVAAAEVPARVAEAAPIEEPADAAEGSLYAASVRRAIGDAWRPREAVRAHQHGRTIGPWRVTLRVSMAADGLREVVVESPSGLAAFDDAAVATVRAVPALPAPPPALVEAGAVYSFPVTLAAAGWDPPQYAGDAMVRSPQTQSWEVGSSLEVQRRTRPRGAASPGASYQRTALTATAAYHVPWLGMVELQVPYATIRYREPATGARVDRTGFGDLALHVYRFQRTTGNWTSHMFLGLGIPTGATVAAPVAGEMTPAVVQLGSGTIDPEFGACLTRQLGRFGAASACDHGKAAFYANAHGYRDVWEFQARLFWSRPFLDRRLAVQVGLLHETRWKAKLDGEDLPGTAPNQVFAEASAWLGLFRGLALRSTVEVPLYQHVDGPQVVDTVRVMAGLTYDFDRL